MNVTVVCASQNKLGGDQATCSTVATEVLIRFLISALVREPSSLLNCMTGYDTQPLAQACAQAHVSTSQMHSHAIYDHVCVFVTRCQVDAAVAPFVLRLRVLEGLTGYKLPTGDCGWAVAQNVAGIAKTCGGHRASPPCPCWHSASCVGVWPVASSHLLE